MVRETANRSVIFAYSTIVYAAVVNPDRLGCSRTVEADLGHFEGPHGILRIFTELMFFPGGIGRIVR